MKSVTLALFDLDHTLLDGDGDDLWCRFAVRHGLVDAGMATQNEEMCAAYRAGMVGEDAFCAFYARLLAGRTPAFWAPWQDRFLSDEIRPRLPNAARKLVDWHRSIGDRVVLTTASNSVIAERSAAELGFGEWLSTDLELEDGVYTGKVRGRPNMRGGKLVRFRAWLRENGLATDVLKDAWFYSDSINDLPLLSAVGHPVAANADELLSAHARANGWRTVRLLEG